MAQHHLAVMFALVAAMSSGATTTLKFALLPEIFDLTYTMIGTADVGVEDMSAQKCVDFVVAADPTALAISFDSTTGACKYSTQIYSYYPRVGIQEPCFYLRADTMMKDPSASDCLTEQDSEYLIAILSFSDDEQCVEVIFGNVWYCYEILAVVNASSSLIKDNHCEVALGSGWAPVKIAERREYGYVEEKNGGRVYVGAYRPDGATFQWYDVSAANDLPWYQSAGPSEDPANDMVYVNFDTSVSNYNAHDMTSLACKTPAMDKPYDPTAKFV